MSKFELPPEREALYIQNARAAFDEQINPWLNPVIDTLTPTAVEEAERITEHTSREGWLHDELMQDLVSDSLGEFLDQPEVTRALLEALEDAKTAREAKQAEQAPLQAEQDTEEASPSRPGSLIPARSSAA